MIGPRTWLPEPVGTVSVHTRSQCGQHRPGTAGLMVLVVGVCLSLSWCGLKRLGSPSSLSTCGRDLAPPGVGSGGSWIGGRWSVGQSINGI